MLDRLALRMKAPAAFSGYSVGVAASRQGGAWINARQSEEVQAVGRVTRRLPAPTPQISSATFCFVSVSYFDLYKQNTQILYAIVRIGPPLEFNPLCLHLLHLYWPAWKLREGSVVRRRTWVFRLREHVKHWWAESS